jgi:hypothetical protein
VFVWRGGLIERFQEAITLSTSASQSLTGGGSKMKVEKVSTEDRQQKTPGRCSWVDRRVDGQREPAAYPGEEKAGACFQGLNLHSVNTH